MSYDLYFLVPEDREPVSIEDFGAYFAGRPRYRVDGAQAIYRNEDTGVQFLFDYVDPESDAHDMTGIEGEEEEAEAHHADGWRSAHVAVGVNYLRPHVFGLEAAPEIEAFVEAFDLSVEDPQSEGMGRGSFSVEGFLRGWNEGNRFAYHAAADHFVAENPDAIPAMPVLPSDEIERCWRWNYAAGQLQESLGDAVSVPTIRFLRDAAGVRSFVVWTDAAPTALPQADLLVLVRDAMAPRGGLFRRKKSVVSIVPFGEASRVLDSAPTVSDHAEPYRLLETAEPPAPVLGLFEAAPPMEREPEGVGAGAVLNEEALAEAMEAAKRPEE